MPHWDLDLSQVSHPHLPQPNLSYDHCSLSRWKWMIHSQMTTAWQESRIQLSIVADINWGACDCLFTLGLWWTHTKGPGCTQRSSNTTRSWISMKKQMDGWLAIWCCGANISSWNLTPTYYTSVYSWIQIDGGGRESILFCCNLDILKSNVTIFFKLATDGLIWCQQVDIVCNIFLNK